MADDTGVRARSDARAATDETLAAYEARSDRYLAAEAPQRAPAMLAWMERFVALLPDDAGVLELGSGPGTDALLLEERGVRVLRSDATRAFADRLRGQGHDVLDLDVRSGALPPGVDGVFANAVLLHLDRAELAAALRRLAGALRRGGVLCFSVKEGDGEAWSAAKLGLPRRFTYWREGPLHLALEAAGFEVWWIERRRGAADDWLLVLATARGERG